MGSLSYQLLLGLLLINYVATTDVNGQDGQGKISARKQYCFFLVLEALHLL